MSSVQETIAVQSIAPWITYPSLIRRDVGTILSRLGTPRLPGARTNDLLLIIAAADVARDGVRCV